MTSTLPTDSRIYTAHYLIPTVNQIIEHGALLVRDSRIVAVSTHEDLRRSHPHAHVTDYGTDNTVAVITPGFINTHTHLELTAMRGFLDDVEHDFFAWLRKLTLARRDMMNEEDLYISALFGATEAIRSGITCIADASDSAATTIRALHDAGLRATVYQELFGIDERLAQDQLANLKNKVSLLRELATSRPSIPNPEFQISNFKSEIQSNPPLVRAGISPHAPYTVSGKLIELAAQYAIDENLPVMIHAAESQAELAFMMHGHGAFADGLKTRNIAWTPPQTSTVRYLYERGLLNTKPLLTHCITVDEHDLDLIKHHDASIAHCPKSNLKLGHGRAPFPAMLKHKIPVGLGSDSVASNNTNDMLEEARFATLLARLNREDTHGANFDVQTRDTFDAITHGGARALRLDDHTGTLEAGKQADFAVVRLSEPHQQPIYDVMSALINSSSARDVLATVIAGREVFMDGKVTTIDEDDLRARIFDLGKRLAASA